MVRIDIKRTDFYNELSKEKQRSYFETVNCKYLPNVDNIYYTVSIKGDVNGNEKLDPIFDRINELRQEVKKTHEPQAFNESLYVDFISFNIYKYCLSCPDLYDIFIIDYLPNDDTPRIVVQIRSYGLWIKGWEEMINHSFSHVEMLLFEYGCLVHQVRENRIDYCYHTNAIKTPEKIFKDRRISETMETKLTQHHATGRIGKGKNKLIKDYFALGERKSNYVFIRFYNKILEVIEKGYKGYFFKIWNDAGIISFYDKYCFEYAYKEKNYDAVHKARLLFYMDYGENQGVRREFELTLADGRQTASDIKALADAYMPEVTTVFNIELETKRKFYYLSDAIIEQLGVVKRPSINKDLMRLYKVLDNRVLFLDYLTDNTVKFLKKDGQYCDWWERLRRVKIDGIKTDQKLLRDYSNELDHEMMRRRFINTVAGNAVYMDKQKKEFLEDLTDVLALINDNDKYNVHISYFDGDGELKGDIDSGLLRDYQIKKNNREKRIRNRLNKKRPTETADQQTDLSIPFIENESR
jgi:hypothetical protein